MNQSSAQPAPAVMPYAWVILAVVYFASVVAPLNQFLVPPIMPLLMEEFAINLAQAGFLMSYVAIIGLVIALPAGIFLQRWGSRTTGLIALGCIAAGAAMGALVESFVLLLASRIIVGAGIGLISVVAPATISMWFPPEKQGGPLGIWATWVPVGSVLMYVIAPPLASAFGWQSVWWLGAGFALLMMVFYAALVRQPPGPVETAAPDPAQADTPGAISGLRKSLANRDIWLLAAEFACFSLALVSIGTYYPTFLNEVRGLPLEQAAVVASIGTAVVLISAPLGGWLSDRIGSRRLVFSLPYLGLAVLMLFPFTATGGWIVVIMLIQGFLAGGIATATFAAAPEVMRRPQLAGLGLAVVLIGQNIGQVVGPIIFGQAVSSLGWPAAGYLMAPVCVLGFIFGWKVKVR